MRMWILRAWALRGAALVGAGALLSTLSGCAHNPNHGINMEQARAAAHRIHPAPPPGVKIVPGAGG